MRNLLGRLNARSPEELARIAQAWGVDARGGDRHRAVSRLYRALTDPRSVRDGWDRLAGDERAMVRHLALTDAPRGIRDLAADLAVPEAAARETATRLYRAGILAREGDDDPLPVGATARLFLPRELALLFRRVQDEIEAGDLAGTPLRALLELLDDTEVEDAARTWGLPVIAGLRAREDLTRQLLREVADPARSARVVAKRTPDAAAIWRRVRDDPDPTGVPLAAAADALGIASGIAPESARPADAARLRDALAELESALLVWHTYRADGDRRLFVPAEIRTPGEAPGPELPPLTPLAPGTVPDPPWRHPDAAAWDLLTLLRELSSPEAPRGVAADEFSRAWKRRLNRRLWVRGDDVPPEGYLDLLLALARGEGLLRETKEPDDAADDDPFLRPTAGVRPWRDLAFPEQGARLLTAWLNHPERPEGAGRADVSVWGADWRGFRRRLLTALGEWEPGTWYPVENVAARLAARDPDLLGATFTAATARETDRPEDRAGDRRRAAVAEVVALTLHTVPAWFGLVELGAIPGHATAVRLTPTGAAIARGDAALLPAEPDGAALAVRPNGDVTLRLPTPLRVWSLSAFAEPARLGQESVYRLTEPALARALAAGFDLGQVTAFLTKQAGGPLPDAVADRLAGWAHGYRRVRLRRAILLSPDDAPAAEDLVIALRAAGWTVRPDGGGALLVELPPGAAADGERALLAALRERGVSPQWG
ncbi:MAG: hypothetical protein AVDCRST_MAG73-2989 [uncultured Thermomicrobiales bacterium]|uniref:Helicase XPB/Ssl2 N-terminal domain-containing protein n=1 Tax=uncultured Thermomicrobiales bacterium TaxID=1645740 RepID=A0A6J4UNW0_9BACT|nr:MAG: hypothetical protein AVDCRST_MAG73-2989 [uncultured Thermomicrobiales bacterium]